MWVIYKMKKKKRNISVIGLSVFFLLPAFYLVFRRWKDFLSFKRSHFSSMSMNNEINILLGIFQQCQQLFLHFSFFSQRAQAMKWGKRIQF